ncbi:hypothetical protein ASPVEDRAFT_38405 [Aspergillus versicolor CBS 583.65]|uniref:Uncharacterized protein n=1 Tax=Aspergillus versicolor CBS 583.65 TaxID=1036611 RepID=A0A1L9PBP9_ASPVE|nr:uncharacterized protein ASPVEDRAFT_38405 [Aspergillus versicolor CBS 583.65]OJI98941.1 hypothetical protein ASPVEDRAFT_38405 [Aspergillus versicolor CBS 583.65]
MKASLITALAAMTASVAAAPAKTETWSTEFDLGTVTATATATATTSTSTLAPSATSSIVEALNNKADGGLGQGSGHIVQDAGHELDGILTITGPNAQKLLIKLAPEVAGLLSSLGLPPLGTAVGSVVASASSIGELVTGLGPNVDGLLTAVGAGGDYLLIQLSPVVAGLLSGLGLPGVGVPVGTALVTVGNNLKRDILGDIIPNIRNLVEVEGDNAERLLIQLSPSVTALVTGLGLPTVGAPLGKVIDDAADVGKLVNHVGAPVEELLTVVRKDGKALLIRLSPDVAATVAGLGLTGVGASVGSVVATLGNEL